MQSQLRTLVGLKTKQRMARHARHDTEADTTMLELEELEYPPLENEPGYCHAEEYYHRQPGDMCEEDAEHAQAEISELFHCADRL